MKWTRRVGWGKGGGTLESLLLLLLLLLCVCVCVWLTGLKVLSLNIYNIIITAVLQL